MVRKNIKKIIFVFLVLTIFAYPAILGNSQKSSQKTYLHMIFYPSDDTCIRQLGPENIHGFLRELTVRNEYGAFDYRGADNILIRFDISSIPQEQQ